MNTNRPVLVNAVLLVVILVLVCVCLWLHGKVEAAEEKRDNTEQQNVKLAAEYNTMKVELIGLRARVKAMR